MTDLSIIENLVDRYVECWRKSRPQYTGIYEDNDFGCEDLQIFRNDFAIETFAHHELCHLSALLTRSLRGQINKDHKLLWSWCAFTTLNYEEEVDLFADQEWVGHSGALSIYCWPVKKGS